MPFDQNGNYRRLYGPTGWQDDRDAGTKILSARHDEDGNDTAAALNECFLADGRKTASGHFKMGGNRIGGLGDAKSAQDAAAAKQIQTNAFNYAEDVSAEANLIKINLTPAPQALPKSMFLAVKIKNANTGKTTLQLGALEAKPVCLGAQEIGEGMLEAGRVYVFFYNGELGAFQLLPSGAAVGPVVPPWTMIMLDHLLAGKDAVGWELQGTRCYKSKYWDQYRQLVSEYAEAVVRTETVEGTEFAYKVNLDTMRRFYSKNDYDARFALCGDTGGYALDEETYSFYLPKSNNYFRPAVDADNLAAYQTDTMRPLTGTITNYPNWGNATADGMFEIQYGGNAWGGLEDWRHQAKVVADSGKLGAHFDGAETAPKSRFVAVYYKMGSAYTEQISQAALAAEQYAGEARAAVGGIDGQVQEAKDAAGEAAASAKAGADSAREAKSYSSGALGLLTNKGVVKFWRGTTAEYQAVEPKDPDTLYLVEE